MSCGTHLYICRFKSRTGHFLFALLRYVQLEAIAINILPIPKIPRLRVSELSQAMMNVKSVALAVFVN